MKGIDVIVEQAGSHYQIAVVRVLGQIDTTTSHELERRLQYLLKDHQFEIIIELSRVTYISSAGWGIFISEIRGIRENGGDLKLVGMTPEVTEVFRLLEFHNILESFKTVDAAVEKFEKLRTPPGPGAPEKQKLHEPTGEGGAGTPPTSQEGAASYASEVKTAGEPTSEGALPASGPDLSAMEKQGPDEPVDAFLRVSPAERRGSHAMPMSKNLEAMILEIVREHPEYGCLRIRKELLEHDYRRPINPLALFMELKRLGLETKEKRRLYADSFASAGSKK